MHRDLSWDGDSSPGSDGLCEQGRELTQKKLSEDRQSLSSSQDPFLSQSTPAVQRYQPAHSPFLLTSRVGFLSTAITVQLTAGDPDASSFDLNLGLFQF